MVHQRQPTPRQQYPPVSLQIITAPYQQLNLVDYKIYQIGQDYPRRLVCTGCQTDLAGLVPDHQYLSVLARNKRVTEGTTKRIVKRFAQILGMNSKEEAQHLIEFLIRN